MKTEIDHLPAKQQGELEFIKQVLMEEFARSIERSTKDVKRNGKILKIILFGSYARSDWVDEPENGYQSDFDLLVVVSHEDLTDIADHWYVAEDTRWRSIKRSTRSRRESGSAISASSERATPARYCAPKDETTMPQSPRSLRKQHKSGKPRVADIVRKGGP